MSEFTAFTTVVKMPLTLCRNICANGEAAEWWIEGQRDESVYMHKDCPHLDVLMRMIEVRTLRKARYGRG